MATDRQDEGLEALFAVARDDQPSPGVQARVLADALAVQQSAPSDAAPAQAGPSRGWLADVLDGLGGWPTLSGVTAAGVVGLGLGFYAPDVVDSLSGGQLWNVTGTVATMPDIGALWMEVGDV